MKAIKLLCVSFLCLSMSHLGYAQITIWDEDFSNEADNAQVQNGATVGGTPGGTWSVTTTPSGGVASFSKQTHIFGVEIFQVNQTGALSEGVWATNVVNLGTPTELILSTTLYTAGASGSDYIRCYYKVDGGPEVLFGSLAGSFINASTPASTIVTGTTIQIVVRGLENTGGNFPFTSEPNAMGFDDVTIVQTQTLYSRISGDWGTAGTWSTAGLGGTSCGCTPNGSTHVVVGNSDVVSITAAANAVNVTVQNTATLRWTTDNVDLNINRGGDIVIGSTASINRNGFAGAQIDFDWDNETSNITVAGTLSIGDIEYNASATTTISGAGTITIADDFLVNDASFISNNLTGTFTITDDLNFNTDNATFTNNRTLTAGDLIVNDNADDGNTFTNASTGVFTVGSINLNNGNFTINNSGTINQSGNFTNIDTGSNGNFNNLATGTWNWSLTPNTTFDLDMITVLDCAASGNTFNYNAAGDQRIIPCQYGNLTMSNSGAKDSNSQIFSVNGNWTVSGTATFTEGTGTITLNGSANSQTISNPSGETFRNLIINNTFGTSPQIILNNPITISVLLTMTDGNINMNGQSVTIATSGLSHGLSASNGWMYGGNLSRGVPTTAIAVGNVNGLFPLGISTEFRPFFVGKSNTGGSSGTITVSHTDAITTSDVSILDPNVANTIVKRHDSFWTVTTATLNAGTWDLRAGGDNFGVIAAGAADIRMATSSGVVGTHSAGSGGPTDWRVNRTGLTFGQLTNNFHVASTNATTSPLPVQLTYFRAKLNNNQVDLAWETAQELNNNFFTIEKTSDLESFEDVVKRAGQGTTQQVHRYSAIDYNPYFGRSYYRLKQTDFDGKFSYSDIQTIDYEGSGFASLHAYPNPLQDRKLTIEVKGLQDARSVSVEIMSAQGQKIMSRTFEVRNPGSLKEELVFESPLPAGLYIIKAGPSLLLTQKIVIE